ncbi:MAG: bacterio-opsin activator domain-containing protein [Halobacteriaceae archaeon]
MTEDFGGASEADAADDFGEELAALRSSDAFQGPVDPPDPHESVQHLALVYETAAEQFETVGPVFRQGLDCGDRCVYVADDNTTATVRRRLTDRGVDVEAAVDSGALSIVTGESYVPQEPFSPEAQVDTLEGLIEDVTETDQALRIAVEMTWFLALDESFETLVAFEAAANRAFREDAIALCQYNRDRFPPDALHDAIEAHPYVVVDQTISPNAYYTPPGAQDGDAASTPDIDQLLSTLREWTEAKTQLRERTERLEAKTAALERLNRINALVQELVQALVEEPSRGAIEQTVCSRLASSAFYSGAWIGDCPVPGQQVRPRTWAGLDESSARAMTEAGAATGARGLAERAVEAGKVQAVRHVAEDATVAAGRDALLAADVEAALAVPLEYEDKHYGVLVVAASRPDAFDAEHRTVLDEFGRTLSFAVTAAERKQALATDEAVEIEVRLADSDHVLVRATAETEARLTLDGVTTRDDGAQLGYVTVTGAPAEEVMALAERSDAVERVRVVESGDDGGRLERVATGPTATGAFAEYGGRVTGATAADGVATVTVELPPTADLGTVFDAFTATFPDAELVAKRRVDDPDLTEQRYLAELTDELTDKQRSVLETAYLAGYFDRPRISSGEEVAATLGLSPSTFHQHLRVAERKLAAAFVTGRRDDRAG